ncbi:MAG: hypothetical protein AB7S36_20960, partial [Planctomycetota bacterium]
MSSTSAAADWKPQVWARLARHPLGMAGTAAGLVVVLAAILAPLIVNDVPLASIGPHGALDSPWLESLLDSGRYPAEHDRYFNCCLLILMVALVLLPFALVARRVWLRHVTDFWSTALLCLVVSASVLWFCLLLPAFHFERPAARYQAVVGDLTLRAPVYAPLVVPRDTPDATTPARHHRPVVAATLAGLRRSLALVLLSTAAAALVGWLLGLIAARAGGALDQLIMWLADTLHSVPALLVVLATLVVLPPALRSPGLLIGLLALCALPGIVRHVRRETPQESASPVVALLVS